jgi:F-type H+-transporting ATPase subunit delta
MTVDNIGNRYAVAVYKLAYENNKVIEVYKDLEKAAEAYESSAEIKKLIGHPALSVQDKKNIMKNILGAAVSEFSLKVIDYLIDKKRLEEIKSILIEYVKIYYKENNYIEVEAVFAIEPSKEQIDRLIAKINKKTGKQVKVKVTVDESIIGGAMIKIEDQIIDGSLKRQFEMLKASL